jgi:cGMP-dependent protein kinase 1
LIGKGESFGEQALYYKTVRSCTVKAETEVKCFALSREEAVRILGNQVQVITFKNVMRWAFERSSKLKKLTNLQIERVLEAMKITSIKKNEVFCKKGEKLEKIVIPIDCNIIQVYSMLFFAIFF